MYLKNDKLFQFVSHYYSLNRFTCIPDSATMCICRMNTFFPYLPTVSYNNHLTCTLLMEKQYVFEV